MNTVTQLYNIIQGIHKTITKDDLGEYICSAGGTFPTKEDDDIINVCMYYLQENPIFTPEIAKTIPKFDEKYKELFILSTNPSWDLYDIVQEVKHNYEAGDDEIYEYINLLYTIPKHHPQLIGTLMRLIAEEGFTPHLSDVCSHLGLKFNHTSPILTKVTPSYLPDGSTDEYYIRKISDNTITFEEVFAEFYPDNPFIPTCKDPRMNKDLPRLATAAPIYIESKPDIQYLIHRILNATEEELMVDPGISFHNIFLIVSRNSKWTPEIAEEYGDRIWSIITHLWKHISRNCERHKHISLTQQIQFLKRMAQFINGQWYIPHEFFKFAIEGIIPKEYSNFLYVICDIDTGIRYPHDFQMFFGNHISPKYLPKQTLLRSRDFIRYIYFIKSIPEPGLISKYAFETIITNISNKGNAGMRIGRACFTHYIVPSRKARAKRLVSRVLSHCGTECVKYSRMIRYISSFITRF